MKNTVYATFINPELAKKAAGALLDHGVRSEHITIVFPEGYMMNADGKVTTEGEVEHTAEAGITTTTAADAAKGASKGAGLGLVAGALAALACVFVPGVGIVLGGGALALAIGGAAGATAAGAVAGGVTGYLKDQGVPEASIEDYSRVLGNGGAIISVFPDDEKVDTETIQGVLTKYDGSVTLYADRATVLTY